MTYYSFYAIIFTYLFTPQYRNEPNRCLSNPPLSLQCCACALPYWQVVVTTKRQRQSRLLYCLTWPSARRLQQQHPTTNQAIPQRPPVPSQSISVCLPIEQQWPREFARHRSPLITMASIHHRFVSKTAQPACGWRVLSTTTCARAQSSQLPPHTINDDGVGWLSIYKPYIFQVGERASKNRTVNNINNAQYGGTVVISIKTQSTPESIGVIGQNYKL